MVLLSSRKMAFALEMSRLRDPQKVCQKIVFRLFIVISVPILFGLVENSKRIAAKSEDIMRGLLLEGQCYLFVDSPAIAYCATAVFRKLGSFAPKLDQFCPEVKLYLT